MSESEPSSPHAYFQALEEAFIRLRGAPLLLSPSDWQIAKRWRQQGIPLELAIRVMERIFERQESAEKKTGIRSLRYFRAAVERSWRRIEELGGGDANSFDVAPIDMPARLERLAAALETRDREAVAESLTPSRTAALQGVGAQIRGLTGDAQCVERALQAIDRALLERVGACLGEKTLSGYETAVKANLGRISGRVADGACDETFELLLRRELRREFNLPVLSLFSPDARSTEESS